jgi:hypothetical protein
MSLAGLRVNLHAELAGHVYGGCWSRSRNGCRRRDLPFNRRVERRDAGPHAITQVGEFLLYPEGLPLEARQAGNVVLLRIVGRRVRATQEGRFRVVRRASRRDATLKRWRARGRRRERLCAIGFCTAYRRSFGRGGYRASEGHSALCYIYTRMAVDPFCRKPPSLPAHPESKPPSRQ